MTSTANQTLHIRNIVEELFINALDVFEATRTNPVTGGQFTRDDSIEDQKRAAFKMLAARSELAAKYPHLPKFPTGRGGCELLKMRLEIDYVVGAYAFSLVASDFDPDHPQFAEFASGLLALPYYGARLLAEQPKLAIQFPPKPLAGMNRSGVWVP